MWDGVLGRGCCVVTPSAHVFCHIIPLSFFMRLRSVTTHIRIVELLVGTFPTARLCCGSSEGTHVRHFNPSGTNCWYAVVWCSLSDLIALVVKFLLWW